MKEKRMHYSLLVKVGGDDIVMKLIDLRAT